MNEIILKFDEIGYTFPFVFVRGTGDHTFLFGLENDQRRIRITNFLISKYTVTQILWKHVMGYNPANAVNDHKPVEMVSFNDVENFLQKMNENMTLNMQLLAQMHEEAFYKFRLPSETEWEYAARGGIYWGDYFLFSGSDNVDEVGWYKHNSNNESKIVGQKKPNQLGIHDMCGNIWEWCTDYFQRDTSKIPRDGSACMEESNDHVLRGGCFHNYGIHCTVMKRYEIGTHTKDPCIGFRMVLSAW